MTPARPLPSRSLRRRLRDFRACPNSAVPAGRSPALRGAHAAGVPFSAARRKPRSPINRCESSCRECSDKKRVRLPRPVRHERGEGCFTIASGPALPSDSSPRPSPPFRTEEREPETPVRTARTFAKADYLFTPQETQTGARSFGRAAQTRTRAACAPLTVSEFGS